MGQFISLQVMKLGSFVIKIWHVAVVGTVIIAASTGIYLYTSYSQQAQSPVLEHVKNVILFVGGMNSEIKTNSCNVTDTFNSLVVELNAYLHPLSPSTPPCLPTTSMDGASTNIAYFSYQGIKTTNGTAVQVNPYTGCEADTNRLANDVTTFISTLETYRTFYPNAHFTIVAHSLGGLVSLEGASDFVAKFNTVPNIIDKVITVDSPLNGIAKEFSPYPVFGRCIFWSGPIVQDLRTVYDKSPLLAENTVKFLQAKGTAVYTLGNEADCLYQDDGLCIPGSDNVQTQFVSGAFTQNYAFDEGTSFAAGHGAIFTHLDSLNDLIRYILAPIVTISSPIDESNLNHQSSGTPLSIIAKVHCLFGAVNQVQVTLTPTSNMAGSAINTPLTLEKVQGNGSPYLSLNSTETVSAQIAGLARVTIDASKQRCTYAFRNQNILPTVSDYLGTKYVNIVETPTPQPLTSVDWKNFTYSVSCLGDQQFTTVHNGQASDGGVLFQVYTPSFGDLTGDGQAEAIVPYSCTGADFWGEHVLVYTGTATHPQFMGSLPNAYESLASVQSINVSNETLILTGVGYARSDGHCCPSLMVTTSYRWNGSSFVIVSSSTVPLTPTPTSTPTLKVGETITEFSVPAGGDGITAGSDGNLWVMGNDNKVEQITTSGSATEFSLPADDNGNGNLVDITAGPDGNLWFTEYYGKIGRMTPNGVLTEYPVPGIQYPSNGLTVITKGPDGAIWFGEFDSNLIGRINVNGNITQFTIPSGSNIQGMTVGPDGNLWFTELDTNEIGRITPNGSVSEFPIPSYNPGPTGITSGSDGNLWFTEIDGNQIGRITPTGVITEFPVPTPNSQPYDITAGPDGNLWFTEANGNQIGRITPTGVITEFPVPTPNSSPYHITLGPDGKLWFTEFHENQIGTIV